MNRITVLSDELISQIAAGEVIERPASAVKELLENSLDAGATQITVEIEEGGLRKIRIVDNGCGIPQEDLKLALQRHATSKIRDVEDLFRIGSLGFRGEALASIASIAHMTVQSCHEDARVGARLEVNGGKEVAFEDVACPVGTEITVLGLFQHTPARKKYMKTERTEYGHILEMVSRTAMAYPRVGFTLVRDGKVVMDLPQNEDLRERIRSLHGGQTADALIPVQFHQSNLLISGFVGKPELSRRSKKYQFLMVNGRPVESRQFSHAVREGFHSLLMHEKYPWYALDIQMDPAMVDVNVHPRKLELRFVNPQEIFRAVRGSVHHALQANLLSPVVADRAAPVAPVSAPVPQTLTLMQRQPAVARDFAPAVNAPAPEEKVFDLQGTVLRPVAQVANCYIVAESEEGMVLIDQHAAHERVRYARFMEALEGKTPMKQALLTPLEMDLGPAALRIVEDNAEVLASVGFDIEPFGGNSFLVRSVPAGLESREPEQVLQDLVADIEGNAVKDVREAVLTMAACRGAIKFGDALTMPEMQALITDMEATKHCSHCPHGRPAIVTLSFDHLETLFKRKNF